MSVRNSYPRAVLPNSHYFVTFARGENQRCFAVRPSVLLGVLGLFPLFALIYLASTLLIVLRDDMLNALMRRQGAMQAAYEERLADMRSQIDLVTSRQLLDQNSLETRIHEMLSRQAQLENRAAVIATLAEGAGGIGVSGLGVGVSAKSPAAAQVPLPVPRPQMTKAGERQAQLQNSARGGPLAAYSQTTQVDRSLPTGATSFAPEPAHLAPAQQALTRALALPETAVGAGPHPGAVELIDPVNGKIQSDNQRDNRRAARTSKGASLLDPAAASFAADPSLPASTRIGALSRSLQRIEIDQIRSINKIGAVARAREALLRRAIAATGLSPEKLSAPDAANDATGGPFVPFKLDPNGSIFEREVLRFQDNIVAANRLSRIVRALPISRPVGPGARQTSGFGSRVDPFNGRLATHTGLDFREAHGAAVRAAAPGIVVGAGPSGGYGNMVEIDHGNGVTTRYAHLSAINVRDGQNVDVGAQVGRIGSTGRSTGPHLHYEVRYKDHPLDPRQFLAVRERFSLR